MITSKRNTGGTAGTAHGRFVTVQSLVDAYDKSCVILTCDGGNLYFQHSMTPNQARELATFLQSEANWCEQQAKQVEEVEA
jgi:hypothetical protein